MGKKNKVPAGTWIERELFKSRAYMALRGCAPQVLTIFLGKRYFRSGGKKDRTERECTNCDSLTFTYIEAQKKYGITIPRLTRALNELLAKGFITCRYQGGGYKQDKSLYGLSERWHWWRPGTVFEKREKETVQRGFRKPKREKEVVGAVV
jgi:hypothetical protein